MRPLYKPANPRGGQAGWAMYAPESWLSADKFWRQSGLDLCVFADEKRPLSKQQGFAVHTKYESFWLKTRPHSRIISHDPARNSLDVSFSKFGGN